MSAPSRTGLTLIETLAALTILSLAVVAGGRWLVSTARYGESLQRVTSDELATTRTIELLRDDLFAIDQSDTNAFGSDSGAVVSREGGISLITANGVPGDAPGWHRVAWFYDERLRTVTRRSRPVGDTGGFTERVVAANISAWSLADPEDEGENSQEPGDIVLTLSIGSALGQSVRFEGIREAAR